jgi:hypothetical protein
MIEISVEPLAELLENLLGQCEGLESQLLDNARLLLSFAGNQGYSSPTSTECLKLAFFDAARGLADVIRDMTSSCSPVPMQLELAREVQRWIREIGSLLGAPEADREIA